MKVGKEASHGPLKHDFKLFLGWDSTLRMHTLVELTYCDEKPTNGLDCKPQCRCHTGIWIRGDRGSGFTI
jgi:hypothetical protein